MTVAESINKFVFSGIIAICGLVLAVTASAESNKELDYSTLNEQQFKSIIDIKNIYSEIDQFHKDGLITEIEAQGAKQYSLLRNQSQMTEPLELDMLQQYVALCMEDERCREHSLMDRFKGFFSFIHIVWFLASVLILVGIVAVTYRHLGFILRVLYPLKKLLRFFTSILSNIFSVLIPVLARILKTIPTLLYELFALFVALMVVYLAKFFEVHAQIYIAFIGNVLVMLVLSFIFRRYRVNIATFYKKHHAVLRHRPSSLLMLLASFVWIASTLMYQSQLLGFFTIGLLLFWLGFECIISPLVYSFGFRNRRSIIKGTLGAFLLLSLYISVTISKIQIPNYHYFEVGIQYLGTFVYFIGLLIASNKWACRYYRFNYVLLQAITISSGMLILYLGSVYEMLALRGVGGTFFALYLIEKVFEIPWNQKRAAWLILLLGVALFGIAQVVSLYPEYFFITE